MIKEKARVVAIDDHCIWVETSNNSVCGSCSAQKGCGQSLLARWVTHNGYLKVLLNGRNSTSLQINDKVDIGIPEDIVVKSALIIYFLPLLLLLLGAAAGHELSSAEWVSIAGAALGFLTGAAVIVIYSLTVRYNQRYQPVLLDSLEFIVENEMAEKIDVGKNAGEKFTV